MYAHNYPAFDGGLGFKFKMKFKPLKAIKRVTKITKTSFQPKKIMGAVGSVAAVAAGGGVGAIFGPLGMIAGAALGPIIAPKVYSANSATMKALGMGLTAIAVVAGAVVLGPAIAGTLGPVLSSAAGLAGKAVTGMSVFTKAFNMLSPGKQQEIASTLSPQEIADIETGKAQLTEQGVDYAPGSLRVQGQLTPEGYGVESVPLTKEVSRGASLGGIDPLYILGGGALLFLLMQKRN